MLFFSQVTMLKRVIRSDSNKKCRMEERHTSSMTAPPITAAPTMPSSSRKTVPFGFATTDDERIRSAVEDEDGDADDEED